MNTENIKNKLVALEANVDAVLFRSMYEDEEKGGSRLANAALGGAAVGGGFLADRAIMRKYGGSRRAAYGAFGSDAKKVGQAGYGAGMKGWQRSGAQGAGMFSRLKRVVGGAARAMTGGRFGFSEIEGRLNRLIELAEVRVNEKGQRSDQNLRRGAVGLLTGSVTSGVGTMVNADRFSQENEVYRKRDAAGHALVGGLAGVPVAAAGNIAALRMRSPGAMAATAIGGALGALGVGYGVSRAMGERSLDKRKRNAMLARLQGGQQG